MEDSEEDIKQVNSSEDEQKENKFCINVEKERDY